MPVFGDLLPLEQAVLHIWIPVTLSFQPAGPAPLSLPSMPTSSLCGGLSHAEAERQHGIRNPRSGISLLVQWLRLHAPTAEASEVALVVRNLPGNAGVVRDAGLILGLVKFPGGGHGNPLQYSCLENPMDRGAWWAIVHEVAKSWTRLKQLSTHALQAVPVQCLITGNKITHAPDHRAVLCLVASVVFNSSTP